MRYSEIITESSRSAPLYHGTTLEAAWNIINDGYLKWGRLYPIRGFMRRGISATRDKRLNYSHGEGAGGAEIVFVLNQAVIAARYRIVPYNDMGFERDRYAESEEVIVTSQLPVNNKTVSGIILYKQDSYVEYWANKAGIPIDVEYIDLELDDWGELPDDYED